MACERAVLLRRPEIQRALARESPSPRRGAATRILFWPPHLKQQRALVLTGTLNWIARHGLGQQRRSCSTPHTLRSETLAKKAWAYLLHVILRRAHISLIMQEEYSPLRNTRADLIMLSASAMQLELNVGAHSDTPRSTSSPSNTSQPLTRPLRRVCLCVCATRSCH